MAEKLKEWQSSLVWVVGLVFVCGMTYNTVSSMDSRVTVNTGDIKKNGEDIHKNELVQTEINTKLRDIPEMKADLKRVTEHILSYDYPKLKKVK